MYLIFLSFIVVLLFFYFGKTKRRIDIASKIPGPKGVPLFGYIKLFQLSSEDLFSHLNDIQRQYKDYYKLWLVNELWVVVYEPKLVEKILTNLNLVKANDYKYLKPWLGNGLLTNEGKSWFARRKAITPAFHFSILEDFVDTFIRHADILVQKIKTQNINNEDIVPHLKLCAFDNICETAMGVQMNSQTDMNSLYVQAVKIICEITHIRMFNAFYDSDFVFKLTKYYKIYEKNLKIAHETTQKIIEERRQKILSENSNKSENPIQGEYQIEKDEFGRKKKMALLDILLKTTIGGKLLTDDEIREEVNTFMFAGHDTTTSAIGFLLYNIAKYPNIQEKLYEEICSIFGSLSDTDTEKVTLKQLNELKYMDSVIKESMRIHTTVPFIGRQLLEENEIDGIKFPENTNLSIWVYGLCHREDIFPQPDKFIPERFMNNINDDQQQFNPFAYIPFSAGHRNCIGQKFALIEIKIILIRLLQNFQINLSKPNEELILISEIVLKSKNGIHLKFTNRE